MAFYTAVFLHGLGGSSRLFDEVIAELGDDVTPVALDLPGFGDAAAPLGYSVSDTADAVIATIADQVRTPRWLLVGHSMGAKIASVVAHRVLSGAAPVFGLAGVVLLAGSPPSPEPMSDDQRATMRSWAQDGALDAEAAHAFIDDNVGAPLPAAAQAQMLADLRRTQPQAWTAWLDRGSREDWSSAVGTLDLPAVLLAGGADGPLGEQGQRELNQPVYPRASLTVLDGAGHLLPLERPADVARAIARLWREEAGTGPEVPGDFGAVIASARVGARTRAELARRALADDPRYRSTVLDKHQLATLRVLAEVVVPQDGPAIDLAARVDATLDSLGDGWRPAALPPDPDAARAGLTALAGLVDLAFEDRVALVERVAQGELDEAPGGLSAAQLASWFEDIADALARQWVAHPATMARLGFDGFANGGDAERQQGWLNFGADREPWEPVMQLAAARSGR